MITFKYTVAAVLVLALMIPSIMAQENRGLWSESNYVQSAKIHYKHVYIKSKRREDLYHCIDLLREAADRFGHRPELYYMLGTFYAEINAYDTVIAYFDSVDVFCSDESIEEKYRKNCYKKQNFKKKMALLRMDQWETSYNDAIDFLGQFDTVMSWVSVAPTEDSAEVLRKLADLAFEESQTGFEAAILVRPNEARTYDALAVLYQRRQMNKEMVDLYEKEIELLGENDELVSKIAYTYISIPDWENTIIWFDKFIANNPTDVNALINISAAYQRIDNSEKWYEYTERALEVDKENTQLMLSLGEHWYFKMQNATAAQGEIDDSIPGAEAKKAELEVMRIEAMGKAMSQFDRVLAIDSENLGALRQVGILCMLSGDTSKVDIGIAAYEKYITIDPQNIGILDYLGRMYIIKGETKAAIKPYEMLVEIDPGRTDAWERLAELYEYNQMPQKSKVAKAKADELNNF